MFSNSENAYSQTNLEWCPVYLVKLSVPLDLGSIKRDGVKNHIDVLLQVESYNKQ